MQHTRTSSLDDARLFVRDLLVQVHPRTTHEATNGVRQYTAADIPRSDDETKRMIELLMALRRRIQVLGRRVGGI